MKDQGGLLFGHGGYRQLKSFQYAQLVYDITVRFCDRYVDRRSRTRDQMVQAARSGVQNIAEGSQASATSKKTEIRLTQVARASLEELKLDYEDYLRHRGLAQWERDHPLRQEIVDLRPKSADEVDRWVQSVLGRDLGRQSSPIAANAALTMINVACYLIDRQIARLAEDFERGGGFSERMYRLRSRRK